MKHKIILIVVLIAFMSAFVYANDIIAKAGDFYVMGKLGIGTTNPQSKLQVNGVVSADNIQGNVSIPQGVILMWSGSIASIPATCWHIADGKSGTLNLTDKFIVGAGSGYTVGTVGGNNNVTLSIAQMPSHSHNASTITGATNDFLGGSVAGYGINTPYSTSTPVSIVQSVGGSKAHENRPPYYALAYIQKTC